MVVLRQRVTRLRRNLRPVAFAALPLVLAAVATLLGGAPAVLGVPVFFMWGVVGVVHAWRADRAPHHEEGELAIDEATLRFGETPVALSEVQGGTWRVDARLGPVVDLRLRSSRRLRFAVATPEIARRLVAAVGADPGRRLASFRALSPVGAAPILLRWGSLLLSAPIVLVLLLAAWDAFAPWVGTVAAIGLVTLVVAHLPRRIEVGSDGVVVRWLWSTHHIALCDVDAAAPYVVHGREILGAELRLRDGSSVRLPIERTGDGPVETGRLVERIRDAQQLGADAAPSAALAALARAGRTSLAWVSALRGLAAGALADHRTAALPGESYAAIVRDARSSPVSRAAAAVVLARFPGAEAGVLVDAATSSADPALRVALVRAAEADASDEALAEALDFLEASEEKRSARAFLG